MVVVFVCEMRMFIVNVVGCCVVVVVMVLLLLFGIVVVFGCVSLL